MADNHPTVTDANGLALRIGSAAADWDLYLNSPRGYDPAAPIQSVTDALDTAAVVFRAEVVRCAAAPCAPVGVVYADVAETEPSDD